MRNIFAWGFLLFLFMPAIAGAADWYARPYRPGGYGASDGTSYATAFNGISYIGTGAINWNLIQPGDNLYVCGFHDGGGYNYSGYLPMPRIYLNGKHGTADSPITIRGDCPGDSGTIFGSGMKYTDGWVLHDAANNVYSRNYTVLTGNYMTLAQAFERADGADVVQGIARLNRPGNATFASWQPSSYYLDANNTLYYKPASGDANDYTFYTGFEYPNINFQDASYFIVRDLNLMSCNNPSFGCHIGIREQAHHITIDNVSTRWSGGTAIGIAPSNAYITVKNSRIRDAWSGIYAANNITHLVVSNNEIYDINQDGYYNSMPAKRGDCHALALQGGGDDFLLEYNHIHHVGGEGIVWYYDPGLASSMTNTVIRYNHIHHIIDLSDLPPYNQRGIEFGGHLISNTTVYNNSIYSNIIHDIGNPVDDPAGAGIGIRLKAPRNLQFGASWSVYNNVIYNTNYGFFWGFSTDPGFVFKNNIVMNSRTYHTDISSATSYATVDMDNNIYYPDGAAMFYQNGQAYNFQGWINAIQKDQNSMTSDPLFVSPAGDFHLQAASPAIDNGTDVGVTIDFDGNLVPQGSAPEIGAYEYLSGGPSACSDGTLYGQCSASQPLYCENGNLVEKCSLCNCPSNQICLTNESCQVPNVPGDLNNDTRVDILDLGIIATHFGQTSSHPDWNVTADVVASNQIDIFDIVFVASRFT